MKWFSKGEIQNLKKKWFFKRWNSKLKDEVIFEVFISKREEN